MTEAVSTNRLNKLFSPDIKALSDINLVVNEGDCVALIGSNGSGKSTLLKCLTGVLPATEGRVTTLGVTLSDENLRTASSRNLKQLHQRIGWIFQHHGLVKRRSVLSNVVHGLLGDAGSWRSFTHQTAPGTWRELAMDALEDVGLADVALRRADNLSGGQQQRVAVARALVRQPELIIADEPAASLDPVAGHEVMQVLTELQQRRQCTLIFTSHDIDHARQYSNSIVGLSKGQLVLTCRARELSEETLQSLYSSSKTVSGQSFSSVDAPNEKQHSARHSPNNAASF